MPGFAAMSSVNPALADASLLGENPEGARLLGGKGHGEPGGLGLAGEGQGR